MGPGACRPSGQPGGHAGRLRRRESPRSRCRAGALQHPATRRLPLPLLRSPGQRSRRRPARRPRRAGRCWRRLDGGQPAHGMRRVQPRQGHPGLWCRSDPDAPATESVHSRGWWFRTSVSVRSSSTTCAPRAGLGCGVAARRTTWCSSAHRPISRRRCTGGSAARCCSPGSSRPSERPTEAVTQRHRLPSWSEGRGAGRGRHRHQLGQPLLVKDLDAPAAFAFHETVGFQPAQGPVRLSSRWLDATNRAGEATPRT